MWPVVFSMNIGAASWKLWTTLISRDLDMSSLIKTIFSSKLCQIQQIHFIHRVWHFYSLTFVLFVWALNKKNSLFFPFCLKHQWDVFFKFFFISNVSHLLKCWSKYLCNMRTLCSSFTCYSTWLISVLFIVLSCIPLNNFMNICCFLC